MVVDPSTMATTKCCKDLEMPQEDNLKNKMQQLHDAVALSASGLDDNSTQSTKKK